MPDRTYLDDIKIEPDALDLEWVRHPEKYMKWAEKAAQAEDKVKLCKEAMEVIDAKIDKEIREDPTVEKITDSLIKGRVALDQRHREVLQKYNDALYESNIYSAAVKAMDHRKTSLENLVRLWAGTYFAGPKEPVDIRREFNVKDRMNTKARDEAREKTSRRAGEKDENN